MRIAIVGLLLLGSQAPPKPGQPVVSMLGNQLIVTHNYTLNGGPDSVLNRITGPLATAHRHAAVAPFTTRDTFMLARPATGTVAGNLCTISKKGANLSAEVCVAWSWSEPVAPLAPPTVYPPTVDTIPDAIAPSPTPGVWFAESFLHDGTCRRGMSIGGFGWGQQNTGAGYDTKPDSIRVDINPRSPSGCSMDFIHQGGSILTDDSWVEQRFTIGLVNGQPVKELFIGMVYQQDSNYVHREPGGVDNNKILRLWDKVYDNSIIHVGMSTLRSSDSVDVLIVEFSCSPPALPTMCASGGQTGNYSTGPYTKAFRSRSVDTVGFYAKVATSETTRDGIIKVWWNRKLVYNRTDLPLYTTSTDANAYNGFGNGYLPGWANSGWNERTVTHLHYFLIAEAPVAWFLP